MWLSTWLLVMLGGAVSYSCKRFARRVAVTIMRVDSLQGLGPEGEPEEEAMKQN